MNDWVKCDDSYRYIDDFPTGGGLFGGGRYQYIEVFLFINKETGEIRSFRRSMVEKKGIDWVLKYLNNPPLPVTEAGV